MAEVLRIKDGSTHAVLDRKDLIELIDFAAGDEVRRAVEEMIRDIEEEYEFEADTIDEIRTDAEKQIKEYQEKLKRIWEATDGLAEIIWKKEIDRGKLSDMCGKLRNILGTAPF